MSRSVLSYLAQYVALRYFYSGIWVVNKHHQKREFLVLFLCAFSCSKLFAAPVVPVSLPTNAGETLKQSIPNSPTHNHSMDQDILPVMPLPRGGHSHGGAQVHVKEFRFLGVTRFPQSELQALIRDQLGRDLDVADLYAVADRLTGFYRNHGYILARAYLPAQSLDAGIVTFRILEGRYGRVQLNNHSRVRAIQLQPFLSDLKEGQVVETRSLERQLLLMNDIPGVVVHSTLAPGVHVGETSLSVQATSTPLVQGHFSLDNWGEQFTGAVRGSAQVDVFDPTGLGDHLDAYLMDTQYGGTKYGHFAYDVGVGGQGLRLGSSYDSLHYLLAQTYNALHAFGTAQTGSAYMLWPWVRSRQQTVDVTLSYAHRTLHDLVMSVGSQDAKWSQIGSVLINGQALIRDMDQATWSVQVTHGVERSEGVSAASDQVAGLYTHINLDGSWAHAFGNQWTFYAHAQAQRASGNLDLSEKMSLGGPQGVRAYPMGEVQADDAVLGTLELRRRLNTSTQVWAFWDAGFGHGYHDPLPTDMNNKRAIGGPGFGGGWIISPHVSSRLDLAWPVESPATSAPQDRPTIWWQLMSSF